MSNQQSEQESRQLQEWIQLRDSKRANFVLLLIIALLLVAIIFLSILSYPLPSSIAFPPKIYKQADNIQTNPQQKALLSQSRDLKSFNFKDLIDKQKILIGNINKSLYQYQCVAIDPIVHHYDQNSKIMYFQTYYLILPFCLNNYPHLKWSITRQTIQQWHKDTYGIQWAFSAVDVGHRILYYRPDIYNILQIVMLSKLIGSKGLLVLINFSQQRCLRQAITAHGIHFNIQFKSLRQITSFQDFNIIIGNQTILNSNFMISNQAKLLIYSNNGSAVARVKNLEPFTIYKFILRGQVCGDPTFEKDNFGEGFYSIGSLQKQERKPIKRYKPNSRYNTQIGAIQSKFIQARKYYKDKLQEKLNLLQRYQTQRICIDAHSNRSFLDYIVTMYGRKLYNVTLEEVKKWEQQIQSVEWVRAHRHLNYNVYYEIKHSFNLLCIVQIASLIGNNTLNIVCSHEQFINVLYQARKNNLTNIKLINNTSLKDALLNQIIITDNQKLIEDSIQNKYLSNTINLMLGFFTTKRNQSLQCMWKTYVNHQLKQVITPKANTQCIGFQYLHFIWNSQSPQGFYEIKESKYVIYAFWGGSPHNFSTRKKLLVQQLISNSVQTKIIGPTFFYYFEKPDSPIHAAYPYLTSVHKSDYFRGYMMHHYGGGYSDVKHSHFDWRPYFEQLQKNQYLYASGYYQKFHYNVGCSEQDGPPKCRKVQSQYYRMIGNGHFIFKKQTPLSLEWFTQAQHVLDSKLQAIIQNPPQVPREKYNQQILLKNGSKIISKYPLRWAQLAGQKLSRAQYKYLNHLYIFMPQVIGIDYRSDNSITTQVRLLHPSNIYQEWQRQFYTPIDV